MTRRLFVASVPFGFGQFFFDTFYKRDQYPDTEITILTEKDAQYQKGFGAMVLSQVTCTYDLPHMIFALSVLSMSKFRRVSGRML